MTIRLSKTVIGYAARIG